MRHAPAGAGIADDAAMLPAEIVKQVRRIQLTTGRQVADVLAGAYVSVFKGRGVEFDEVRPYVPRRRRAHHRLERQPARVGAPYVKRYVEERQLTVMLLVDVSASLDFGSARRSKREAAVELSALLAFSAIHNDDKVGAAAVPSRRGRLHPAAQGSEARLARGARSAGPKRWRRRTDASPHAAATPNSGETAPRCRRAPVRFAAPRWPATRHRHCRGVGVLPAACLPAARHPVPDLGLPSTTIGSMPCPTPTANTMWWRCASPIPASARWPAAAW